MSTYLNPTVIALAALDFQKMDIAPGTASFQDAHFAIAEFGSIAGLTITVDRVLKQITKAATSAAESTTANKSLIVSDQGVYNIGTLLEVKANFNDSFFAGSKTSEAILTGAVFSMMVKAIFVDADLDMKNANLDFSVSSLRATNIFFHTDKTSTLCYDVELKTLAAFQGSSTAGTWSDECEYWSYRTEEVSAEETSSVPFQSGDYIWCLYTLSVNFVQESAGGTNPVTYESGDLDAITSNGTQVSSAAFTPFSDATVDLKFALQWAIGEPNANMLFMGNGDGNGTNVYTFSSDQTSITYDTTSDGTFDLDWDSDWELRFSFMSTGTGYYSRIFSFSTHPQSNAGYIELFTDSKMVIWNGNTELVSYASSQNTHQSFSLNTHYYVSLYYDVTTQSLKLCSQTSAEFTTWESLRNITTGSTTYNLSSGPPTGILNYTMYIGNTSRPYNRALIGWIDSLEISNY